MSRKLFKNAKAIVTCNGSDEVIYKGDLLVEDNKIVEIKENIVCEDSADLEVIDCTGMFMYPGLINTHHHMFQAFTRNIAKLEFNKGISLLTWLTYCYQIWQHVDPEYIYSSSLVSMSDGIKFGMTTNFDQFYVHPAKTRKGFMDAQYEAAKKMGVRFHSGRAFMTMTKQDSAISPDVFRETTDEVLEDLTRVYDKYHEPGFGSMYQLVAAPCSPFSVDSKTYQEVIKLARSQNVRIHSHLGEDPEETEFVLNRYGKRPLDWAEEQGLMGPDVWYAHGPYFNEEELKRIGAAGTGISYCPVPMLTLGSEILDIPKCKKYGVTVGLGTDGQGVQDGSNMLEVLRLSYLIQCQARGIGHDVGPTAYECLKLATNGSSKLLGRTDIGHLEKGMAADFFLVDTRKLELVGSLEDPKSFLAKVGYGRTVDMTVINGEIVYRDGKLKNINEEEETLKASKVVEKVLKYI